MNAYKPFVFNPRLSVFIGGYRIGRLVHQPPNNLPYKLAGWLSAGFKILIQITRHKVAADSV